MARILQELRTLSARSFKAPGSPRRWRSSCGGGVGANSATFTIGNRLLSGGGVAGEGIVGVFRSERASQIFPRLRLSEYVEVREKSDVLKALTHYLPRRVRGRRNDASHLVELITANDFDTCGIMARGTRILPDEERPAPAVPVLSSLREVARKGFRSGLAA